MFSTTVMILSFQTDRSGQTARTKIWVITICYSVYIFREENLCVITEIIWVSKIENFYHICFLKNAHALFVCFRY